MRRGKNKFWAILPALLLVLALSISGALAAPLIHGYADGLALAEENGHWGYANVEGQIVIPIQYDSAQSFRFGLAKVSLNGKLGIIRTDGRALLEPEYDTLTAIAYGLYIAQRGDGWGVVSIVPFPSQVQGDTNDLFPLNYESVTLGQTSGVSVLTFVKDGLQTMVPLSSLPPLLSERRIPSIQFPLILDRLPNFSDVTPREWYSVWVNISYNVGLMEGKGENRFDPSGILTVAEAIKLAAHMESRHTGDDFHLQTASGSPWYRASLAYCVASGICRETDFDNYDRPITRAEMARLFAATSLGRSMPEKNDLKRIKLSIPDVTATLPAAESIWSLYSKGIFSGNDKAMTFRPDDNLTRAEAAAIVSRMARAEQRVTLWRSAPKNSSSMNAVTLMA